MSVPSLPRVERGTDIDGDARVPVAVVVGVADLFPDSSAEETAVLHDWFTRAGALAQTYVDALHRSDPGTPPAPCT